MLENTLENKAKFLAIYWGQKVFCYNSEGPIINTFHKNIVCGRFFSIGFLELTQLSQITDEDAIELSNIISNTITNVDDNYPVLISPKEVKTDIEVLGFASFQTVDYLRSKGYALPWMGLSVEQLVSFGWVKLKEDNQ